MSAPKENLHPRKIKYEKNLIRCLGEYKKLLVIEVDNVGSKQLSETRGSLRGRAEILMGKNTVIRKLLRREARADTGLNGLIDVLRGNIGFCFTNGDLSELRAEIEEQKKPAPAKAGLIAPLDVYIEPQVTKLDAGQTSFFQSLNIPTKINRGAVEIIARVKMITEGEKVSASASVLLSMLDLKPFSFGIKVRYVYEAGSCYAAKVLDLSETDIMAMFGQSLNQAASLSLGLSYPSTVAVPHLMSTALKKLVAFSIEADFDLKIAEPFKAFLADPSAFAVAGNGGGDAGGEAQKEEKKEEEEEDDGGFDLDSDEE